MFPSSICCLTFQKLTASNRHSLFWIILVVCWPADAGWGWSGSSIIFAGFHGINEGFPGGTSGKEPTCQCRDLRDVGLIPGLGRSSGGGHGNPLQYSCLENPMDRGTWRAIVHGVAKSRTRLKWLSMHTHRIKKAPHGWFQATNSWIPGLQDSWLFNH